MLANFTTDVVRPSQRVEFWRRFVCNHVADIDCWVDNQSEFRGQVDTYSFGRMSLSTLTANPHRVGRSKNRIDRARNDYFLIIFQKEGSAEFTQNGISSTLERGDFVLYEPRLPYEMILREPFEHVTLRLPRESIESVSDNLLEVIGRPVKASTFGGELVGGMMKSIVDCIDSLPIEITFSYSESIADLISHAILEKSSYAHSRIRRGKGHTLARAKQYILNNLTNDDLNLSEISSKVGVSPRQINRLFEGEGISTSRWIKNMRLDKCAATLIDSTSRDVPISQVAYNAGFSDISHFCRDFKAKFKLTPSEYRRKFNNHEELELLTSEP